jgi:glycosyltransferase involved in cell wall biosynthesis
MNRILMKTLLRPPERPSPGRVKRSEAKIRVSIIIPVFNEAATVRELLERVVNQPLDNYEKELVIVESNSTDGSRDIVRNFIEASDSAAGIKVIWQEQAKGKGFAIREGLGAATGDIVLIQDADLEYDTEDYMLLLEPIARGHVDFVLGSRHLAAGTWKIREFETDALRSILLNLGGIVFHGFFNLMFHQQLTDPTTMYKVFRRSCIKGLKFECNRFDFDFELVGKLIRSGYLPLEVPVSYHSRGFEEGKKVNVFRDPISWVRAIVRSRFSPLHEKSK